MPGFALPEVCLCRRLAWCRITPNSGRSGPKGTFFAIYAANSFALDVAGEPHLVMPQGVSARLADAVRARGTRIVTADVSEFHKKGGGSVKCMIGDLGELAGVSASDRA